MAQPLAPSRRAMLRGSAAALLTVGVTAAAASADAQPDAELIRVCHAFAEAELRNWWRYVTAPVELADAQDTDPDWTTLEWIETTPATTPAGWAAKALALAAWHREAYDDSNAEGDASATLLAGLLRDMAAPARAEILTRCASDYGPLPEGYTADGRWISQEPAVAVAALSVPPRLDAELLSACETFSRARAEVLRFEGIPETSDEVFEPANAAVHDALVQVSRLSARTVAGARAKAGVCRAVLAMDEPSAVTGRFNTAARRHDVLA